MRIENGAWLVTSMTTLFFVIGFFMFRRTGPRSSGPDDETLQVLIEDVNRYIKHLSDKHPHDPRIKRLERVVDNSEFKGLGRIDDDVGYSIDKGRIIAVCTEDGPTNEAIFVLLHELAHVATEDWGHSDVFWSNFSFLINAAEEFGWYTPIDYRKTPGSICGAQIETVPNIEGGATTSG